MPQMRGDGARGPLDCYGICLNAIAANPRHRSGNADRGGDTSTLVQNRGGDAARAHIRFLLVDGIALLQDASELFPESRKVRNGSGRGTLKSKHRRSEEHTSELQSHV